MKPGVMGYSEAIKYLYSLSRFGMRPGLERTSLLAAAAGNPHETLGFIHVAGTNGKGSTCAFLESVYRRAGYRTGLFTSPHLVSFRERVQVNREHIPEEHVARLVAEIRPLLPALGPGEHITFFEFITVMALRWFREQQCEVVVWETGMGGRLDATNIVMPLAAVITNVGWDHMPWLGHTVAAIAAEKAGIIKPGRPVITTAEEPGGLAVIRRVAQEREAPLKVVGLTDPEVRLAESLPLPLLGEHQTRNAALACATVRVLHPSLPVSKAALRHGLMEVRWPGRFDVIQRGRQTLILDGAHNRPAFQALAETLRLKFRGRGHALILGMLADKDAASAAEHLAAAAERIVVVPVHSSRGSDPAGIARLCSRARQASAASVEQGSDVIEALEMLAREEVIVITGSLYLVGEVLRHHGGGTISERDLNDWSPRP
jgi:dihydrofolate synthase/folylpolyglutamate synthase